jgi:type VI secretion system Hcp family effector
MPRHALFSAAGLMIFFAAQSVYADSCTFTTLQQGAVSNPVTKGNTFEIDDFSFDVEQVLNVGSQSSGAGAGKVTFNPFQITKKVDVASTQLFQMAINGEAIKSISCSFYNERGGNGASFEPYLTAVLTNATIARFKVDGTGTGTPTVKFWLNFERIE